MAVADLEEQVAALRRELNLIWQNHEREHSQHESAHAREHSFAQTAIDKAAEMAKENKADANEWRGSMSDRETKFATKDDIRSLTEKILTLTASDDTFATKKDVEALGDKIDKLENAEIRRAENERLRLIQDGKDKEEAQRRVQRSQWMIALGVGLLVTIGTFLINLVVRLGT